MENYAEGFGTFKHSDGSQYKGDFVENMKNGICTFTLPL